MSFLSLEDMTTEIYNELKRECPWVCEVQFSNNRETAWYGWNTEV